MMDDREFKSQLEEALADVAMSAEPDQFDELFSELEVQPGKRPTPETEAPSPQPVEKNKRRLRLPGMRRQRVAAPKRSLGDKFKRRRLMLSLEATEARLLVVRGQRILHWDRLPLPEGSVRNGQIVLPTAFGQAIAQLVEQASAPRRKAVVSLSGQGALVRIFDLPAVPARMLEEAVRREARRELPLPLEQLYLSWQVIGDPNASRRQVFVLGVPREGLDNCAIGLRSAGVRPVAMDLKPLALARAVNLADVLIADIEAETESMILVRDFIPHIVRSVASPGGSTRPPDERAEHMAVEIQRIFDFYSSTKAAGLPPWSPVVCLTGALGGEEQIRTQVGQHWPLVEPNSPIPLPEGFPLLSYLTNIGLALKNKA